MPRRPSAARQTNLPPAPPQPDTQVLFNLYLPSRLHRALKQWAQFYSMPAAQLVRDAVHTHLVKLAIDRPPVRGPARRPKRPEKKTA